MHVRLCDECLVNRSIKRSRGKNHAVEICHQIIHLCQFDTWVTEADRFKDFGRKFLTLRILYKIALNWPRMTNMELKI